MASKKVEYAKTEAEAAKYPDYGDFIRAKRKAAKKKKSSKEK